MSSHFPSWLHRSFPTGGKMDETEEILARYGLNTICQSALCPNQGECLASGTATFLILGDHCTRNCRFCAVLKGHPSPPNPFEPKKLAQASAALNLHHVVITSVTRDDLPDGGAGHFAATIRSLHKYLPAATIEVLTPDFKGNEQSIDTVIEARPDVFNHNIETIERLYPTVRPLAEYQRSLNFLKHIKENSTNIFTKSGIMVGLGEKPEEMLSVMKDLRDVGCDILTIGQYLRPSPHHLPVERFVPPDEFAVFKEKALELGFKYVESGPFVRSSYHAHKVFDKDIENQE